MRNDSAHELYKFDTIPITNSKMADKMAAVKHYIVTQPLINIETSFFHWIVRNDSAHQLYKFGANMITNSKMADKAAAVKPYNWL